MTSSGPIPTSEGIVRWHRCPPLCLSLDTLLIQFPCDIWVRQAASGVTSNYDALFDIFECLGSFLKRLEVHTTIPPTPIMMDPIVKIMVQLLSVLTLASKQNKQGRLSK